VKLGENNLRRRNSLFLVHVHGNPAAVVIYHDAVIGPDTDVDIIAKARGRFIDAVINDFVYQMVQTIFAGTAYVHGGSLAYRLKTLQYFYTVCLVPICHIFLIPSTFSKILYDSSSLRGGL
jgi:hypothetical protein